MSFYPLTKINGKFERVYVMTHAGTGTKALCGKNTDEWRIVTDQPPTCERCRKLMRHQKSGK